MSTTYTPIEVPMSIASDLSEVPMSVAESAENVEMGVAVRFLNLIAAEIYVDGTTLVINTSLTDGNEVSY